MSNMYALGSGVSLISDIFRVLFFYIDVLVYSLIPFVYSAVYSLYDFSMLFNDANTLANITNRMMQTVYSFLAIFMFFRVAFSLITMLVDPALIEDKERGAKKIVINIVICLLLIVVVPIAFRYAKDIQARIMQEKWIEKIILGDEFNENESYNLGNEFALSVWGVFLHPVSDDSSANSAYDAVFNNTSNTGLDAAWPVGKLSLELLTVTGDPITSRIPGLSFIADAFDTRYNIAYIYLLSTIAGLYVLWTFIKLMIDVAYRSIKFYALELLSPVAIVSYIDPNSSKKGVFNKWLNETFKTYISLFIRLFVFALTSVLLRSWSLSEIDSSTNFAIDFIYMLAILAFMKTGPKFIDGLFGTTISKDSDTKFASDMFKGVMGGAAVGTTGLITGAHVAAKTGQNTFVGAIKGGFSGIKKGFSAAQKGNLVGVVGSGVDTYSSIKKKYGYDFEPSEEKELGVMEKYVPVGKRAKNDAINRAQQNNNEEIKNEFTRTGKPPRNVNGFDVKYSNLVGDAQAEGAYKQYVATVAENSIIPGMSEEGLKAYNNAAQRKMYATLSKIQSERANSNFEAEYSAFLQRDTAGRESAVIDQFNVENARRAAAGEKTYADWQTMFKDIGGMNPTDSISVESAYKIALDNKIKVETGHNTSEWANIAGKDESDAKGASDEVKRHESSSKGKADRRKKDLYSKAKGKVEAQNYTGV